MVIGKSLFYSFASMMTVSAAIEKQSICDVLSWRWEANELFKHSAIRLLTFSSKQYLTTTINKHSREVIAGREKVLF